MPDVKAGTLGATTPQSAGEARSPYPPIAQYAFLSDCHTAALVAPDGSVEWLCLPSFDAPSVFGALLDRSAGSFRFGPYGVAVPPARRYEPGTLILETTWACSTGWLVVRDALTIGPWHPDQRTPHTRPPSDHEADHLLVRTVTCVQGEVPVELVCEPMFDYGRTPAQWSLVGDHHAADASGGEQGFRLLSDLGLGIEGNRVRAHHHLHEGEMRFCALSFSDGYAEPRSAEQATEHLQRTSRYWRAWVDAGDFPDHRWRSELQRSALTLKGLTYAPTGAILAAGTTSLPEAPGGDRNWDYRFTWMRDATFALWGLHSLGLDWEAEDFMQFVADVGRNEDGSLQIMYGIDGRRELPEHELEDLSGYDGARPVRTGNGAYAQRQNDVYGAVLDSVSIHVHQRDHLPERLWPLLRDQVKCASAVWRDKDQGIWEARGAPQHYVSSKLMCWVALDRGAHLATLRGEPELSEQWRDCAQEIRSDILDHGVSEEGVFRQHYDTDALDASTLLVGLVRFLPGDDERVRNTVEAIASDLTDHGLVLRYKPGETDDGLGGSREGTFTICSFWLVSALAQIGEARRARELCERLLSLASPLGLYAEEIEAQTGRHLGNFPQAFTHLALINAVSHVVAGEMPTG